MTDRRAALRAWPGGTAAVFLMLLAGCDRTWQAYQQAELGRPLPSGHLLLREGRGMKPVRAICEQDVIPFPAIYGILSLRVVADDTGRPVAKFYEACALGHWGICQTAACRWVMEVQIPHQAFHDPPEGWEQRGSASSDRLWKIECQLSYLARAPGKSTLPKRQTTPRHPEGPEMIAIQLIPVSEITIGQRPYRSVHDKEEVRTFAFTLSRKRIRKPVLDRIKQGQTSIPIDLEKDLDLSGEPGSDRSLLAGLEARVLVEPAGRTLLEVALRTPREPCTNVPEYLLFIRDVAILGGPEREPQTPGTLGQSVVRTFFGLAMYSLGNATGLWHLPWIRGSFSGVTRDGYDWRHRNAIGGTCRIRNLGNRRIRIEYQCFRVLDPFMLLALRQEIQ